MTDAEKEQRLWELYLNECEHVQTIPTIRDFVVWKQENGYDEDDGDAD